MALRLEGAPFRVIGVEAHQGGGKMGGVVHARLENIETGNQTERRFRIDERLETLELRRRTLTYLYRDGDALVLMDPESFEQTQAPASLLGPLSVFLKENAAVPVEFFDERPVRIVLPDFADLKVVSTAAPIKGGEQGTWKPATLENGLEVQVPLFIAPGDTIRLEIATRRYAERLRETGRR
jgi:elongation factor P